MNKNKLEMNEKKKKEKKDLNTCRIRIFVARVHRQSIYYLVIIFVRIIHYLNTKSVNDYLLKLFRLHINNFI